MPSIRTLNTFAISSALIACASCALVEPHRAGLRAIASAQQVFATHALEPVTTDHLNADCIDGIRSLDPSVQVPPEADLATVYAAYFGKTTSPDDLFYACLRGMGDPFYGAKARTAMPYTNPRPARFSTARFGGIAYIFIPRMDADIPAKIGEALREPATGAIVDVRGDGGGFLWAGVAVAASFLPPGAPIVETRGRVASENQRLAAIPKDYTRRWARNPLENVPDSTRSIPVAVIVDAATDGAAEIAAAALRDNNRATIWGERTSGRGYVSTILPVPGTPVSIKVPTARYYRIDGSLLESVRPDVEFKPAGAENEPLSEDALRPVIESLRKAAR